VSVHALDGNVKLTSPKDKVSNHSVTLQTGAVGKGVGVGLERRPDRFKHDEHTRCTDVGIDTAISRDRA